MPTAPPPRIPTSGRHGVLFDVDGTLVDTACLHAVCWWGAFRRYGRRVSMPAHERGLQPAGNGSHVSAYSLCALSPLLVYCNYPPSH